MNSSLPFGFCPLCFLLFLCFFLPHSFSDPRATQVALICSNRTAAAPDHQAFILNFLEAMDRVTPLIAAKRYADVITGAGTRTVFLFGECMKDLSQNDCNLCFALCKTQLLRCVPFQKSTRGGRSFYDGCYIRFDDYNFFAEALSSQDRTVCGTEDYSGNQTAFKANAIELVKKLSVEAPGNDGFLVASVNRSNTSVYGIGQCWEFVKGRACAECLANATSRIGLCPPKKEGRVLNAGCFLRYSTQKFYDNSTSDFVTENEGGRRLPIILGVTSSSFAFLVIVATTVFFARKKRAKRIKERKQLGDLLATVNKSKLNFSYESLERATNYFNDSNKLGQGGSGSVYKGIMSDGSTVAIKRLFFNTRQWVDHFFNEVNLISGIDHKNLVKLLGCSITGPESLLVYEYVPNQSLHDHIARRDAPTLSWEMRYKIILGVAEGLAYLHEESMLRIIHRDIKLSNVLLDDEFTAKVADFGLARLFPEDKTHISTAVAGTLGYMAPEYVVRGKLTEKVDVYGFGVLVMEVICGKKNNFFTQDSVSMLQMVWNLYGTGRLIEAIDSSLGGNFEEETVSRVLKVGLVCVQASAELRPAMSLVVKMLTDNHEIPQPTQPPFINSGNVEISPAVKPETSYSLPESSTQSSRNSMTQSWIEPR